MVCDNTAGAGGCATRRAELCVPIWCTLLPPATWAKLQSAKRFKVSYLLCLQHLLPVQQAWHFWWQSLRLQWHQHVGLFRPKWDRCLWPTLEFHSFFFAWCLHGMVWKNEHDACMNGLSLPFVFVFDDRLWWLRVSLLTLKSLEDQDLHQIEIMLKRHFVREIWIIVEYWDPMMS